jgi:N-acetylglutamate synthase-like GNAT family acetyltransferase
MPLAELGVEADPAQRISRVVEFGQVLIDAAVLAKHEAVGVLRALAVEPRMRRQQRGTTLRWYMLRCAYGESIAQVYDAVVLPWFLGDLGSERIDRLLLSKLTLRTWRCTRPRKQGGTRAIGGIRATELSVTTKCS